MMDRRVAQAELREPPDMHPTRSALQAEARQARYDHDDCATLARAVAMISAAKAGLAALGKLNTSNLSIFHPEDVLPELETMLTALRDSLAVLGGP